MSKHHIDRLDEAISLLDEARGFAAMSPAGRDNIIDVADMLPGIVEQAYRSGFIDGESAEAERKGNSSFVPVPEKGTIVPVADAPSTVPQHGGLVSLENRVRND